MGHILLGADASAPDDVATGECAAPLGQSFVAFVFFCLGTGGNEGNEVNSGVTTEPGYEHSFTTVKADESAHVCR